jgi:hypothetical protein
MVLARRKVVGSHKTDNTRMGFGLFLVAAASR